MRAGDESTQQWAYRWQVGTDLSASYDVLPLSEQPGVDADHYYLTSTVLPQVKAEYEEQHLIEEVTGQYDDTHHWLRNRLWFWPTRLMQIIKEGKLKFWWGEASFNTLLCMRKNQFLPKIRS